MELPMNLTDGIYGTNTRKAATKAYQQILGVTPAGIFGSDSKATVKILSRWHFRKWNNFSGEKFSVQSGTFS